MAEKWKETTEHYLHEIKSAGETAWDATQRTLTTARSGAVRVGKLARRRWDLAALDRKMDSCFEKIGRIVLSAWEEGTSDILGREDVTRQLAQAEALKQERHALLKAMARVRAEVRRTAAQEEAPEGFAQTPEAESPAAQTREDEGSR